VQTYEAARLASISRCLTSIGIAILNWDKHTKKEEVKIKNWLSKVISESEFIGLNLTKRGAQRFLDKFASEKNSNNLAGDLDTLSQRFDDEIEAIQFFYVRPEKLSWFENTESAGEQFKSKFPKANAELIEAGNCFALARYTACVFHLTRALEIVLSSLHHALNIPEETDPRNNTWGRKLGRISDKISENDNNPPAGWSNNAAFYKKVNALLAAVKTPLRDDTVHIATVYDETGAGCVFMAMLGALNQVATKLSESNGRAVTEATT
jgi:hypothetical protein